MKPHLEKWPAATSLLLVIGAALLGLASDLTLIALTWLVVSALCIAGALVWCAVAIAAIVVIFKGLWRPSKRVRACISSMILAIGLVIAPFAFWACSHLNLFFHLNKTRYEEVAVMALKGELEQKWSDFQLPRKYRGLSATHSVWLYRRGEATDIMFITAGLGGEVTGYVYSSDGKPPLPGSACRPIAGAGKHWYHGSNEGCDIIPEGLLDEQKESIVPVAPLNAGPSDAREKPKPTPDQRR